MTEQRVRWTPIRPPLSYAVDPFIPLLPPRVDLWFGFNPLAAARGLGERGLGRSERVVLWSVDFTPNRFGPGTALTRLYDKLDRLGCVRADARVELSEAARDARDSRLRLEDDRPPTHVVPMGAWLDRVPVVPPDGFESRRIVFLGHLTAARGVSVLLDALAVLRSRGVVATLEVIGGGDQLASLEERAIELEIADAVRFHGFVADHRDVERLLAQGAIAAAPYVPGEASFTRWADPGKLKAYLGAGLPILLTDVPPNAGELAREAGAEIVSCEAASIADAIEALLASPDLWRARRAHALRYVRRFDWPVLFGPLLERLGFRTA
jgi:glycosyltransferase involved in cell wall biosynthesis